MCGSNWSFVVYCLPFMSGPFFSAKTNTSQGLKKQSHVTLIKRTGNTLPQYYPHVGSNRSVTVWVVPGSAPEVISDQTESDHSASEVEVRLRAIGKVGRLALMCSRLSGSATPQRASIPQCWVRGDCSPSGRSPQYLCASSSSCSRPAPFSLDNHARGTHRPFCPMRIRPCLVGILQIVM